MRAPFTWRPEELMAEPYVVPARPTVLPGYLDTATRRRIAGWAQAGDDREPAALQVLDNGRLIARVIANQHRPDLKQAGFGDGRFGFDLLIPAPMSAHERHIIQVRREADGTELIGSPVVLEASGTFDDDLRELLRQVAGGVQTNDERETILAFLAQIADDLLTDHARAQGGQEQHDHYRRLARRHGSEVDVKPRVPRALLIDEHLPSRGRMRAHRPCCPTPARFRRSATTSALSPPMTSLRQTVCSTRWKQKASQSGALRITPRRKKSCGASRAHSIWSTCTGSARPRGI